MNINYYKINIKRKNSWDIEFNLLFFFWKVKY